MCVCVGSEVKAATFVRTDRCESPFNFKLHPRLLFFPFITHLLLCLSCVFLLPTASLVHSQHTPQRGRLMRANDRKACCCFPFINRCTLVHRTLFIRRLLSARALLFPSSITSLPRLLPFTFFIAHTGQLLSISFYLHLPFLPRAGLLLTTTTTATPSSANTNVC